MKRLIITLIFSFGCLGPSAVAGEITGKITKIKVRDDGLHYVLVAGTVANKPACSLYSFFIIRDENSVYGKSQFSLLVTAFATGQAVSITGKNSCSRYYSIEDISVVELAAP